MKNWKKLLFIATAVLSAGLLRADSGCCGDNSSNCCSTGSTNCGDCCGTDTTACCAGGHITNKTIYIDIGFGASGTYLHENFFRNDLMTAAEDGWNGAFQVVGFGGRTTAQGQEGLGRRFGLNHKRCMVAVEGTDAITAPDRRDIDTSHFNILTSDSGTIEDNNGFSSIICFCPRETFGGALLSWKQGISRRCDDDSVRWWFEINAPIVHVNTNMNLKETIVRPGGTLETPDPAGNSLDGAPFVANMEQAFKQASWKYGKINGCREQTELANLEFKVGYNFINGDCCQLGSYLGFAAKTTACRTAAYVFEPVVGQEHWAFMWGSTFDLPICDWENSSLIAHFAMDSRWWFERSEKRSFDLIGKPWSRYMEMYANFEQAQAAATGGLQHSGTSGINLMTRDVCVTPGYQINCNMGVEYVGCRFRVEGGHTFYARSAEKVAPNWVEGPALKAFAGNGQTNIARTIANQFQGSASAFSEANYNANLIRKCDVDWNSGAHEGILAHTFYGAIAYDFKDWCYPSFISLGGAYDFDAEDAGTSVQRRWTVFGKIGVSF